MARTPSYDTAELEASIGPKGSTPINSANRALVQNWLVSQGFPAAWVKGRRVATLFRCYNKPRYLAKLVELRDRGILPAGTVIDDACEDVAEASAATAPAIETSKDRRDWTRDPGAWKCVACGQLNPPSIVSHCYGCSAEKSRSDLFIAPISTGASGEFIFTTTEPKATVGTVVDFPAPATSEAQPATPDKTADSKLAAAAEALRAAAMLLDGGEAVAAAPKTHGEGPMADTKMVAAKDVFSGIGDGLMVPRFAERSQYVPEIDPTYNFDPGTTLAILLGFAHNRRVLISGRHGTGKTSHVEQVAARLNWPMLRLNLDGHLSRTDLIGRDSIVLQDGKQITEFREGILPWAMQQPMALCLDEYDAGRPDVLFVVQRLLESGGKLTIAEQNRVVTPHSGFRLFGTANTVGLGDATGLYHGTNPLNAAQMDRWNIAVRLDYLPKEQEIGIVMAKCPKLDKPTAAKMVKTATATRALFAANKISTVMSPRTIISWGENAALLGGNMLLAFEMTFLNKCDDSEIENIRVCYSESFRGSAA